MCDPARRGLTNPDQSYPVPMVAAHGLPDMGHTEAPMAGLQYPRAAEYEEQPIYHV